METTVTPVATVPLNFTVVPPLMKLAPSISTVERFVPMVGEKSVTMGPEEMTKLFVLVALPALVVTVTGPVTLPAGTVALTWLEAVTTPATAVEPVNLTVVAPVMKLAPNIATGVVPALPEGGLKLEIVGATTKLLLVMTLEPLMVSPRGPVVAPSGTTVCNTVSEMMMKSAGVGLMALRLTEVVPRNPDPLIVITLPGCPKAGEKPVIFAERAAAAGRNVNNRKRRALALVTGPHKIADNVQLLIAGDGMLFGKFAPVDLHSVPPQQFKLWAGEFDGDHGIVCPVRDEDSLPGGGRRKFFDHIRRFVDVSADANYSRQAARISCGNLHRHEAALRKSEQ